MLTAKDDGWGAVRERVLRRDAGCIAVRQTLVGPGASSHPCRDKWGLWMPYDAFDLLELDHVKEAPPVGAPVQKRADKHSRKAPDDEAHLVSVCPGHHRGTGDTPEWATSHRAEERAYLAGKYPEVWGNVRATT